MEQESNNPVMLIIPDVHGRMFWRSAIKRYPDLPTIFLGDYLDPYTSFDGILPSEALFEFKSILQFKQENPDRVTLLLGNHDVHYLNKQLNSSRKDWMNQDRIAEIFSRNLSLFQLVKLIRIGETQMLFSHAGIIPEWMELHFPEVDLTDTALLSDLLNAQLVNLDQFKRFISDALMDRSASRWGSAQYPSVIWADVEDHQMLERRLPNVYQVFGHTQQEFDPIITKNYANLDCRKAFLLMEDGTIKKAFTG